VSATPNKKRLTPKQLAWLDSLSPVHRAEAESLLRNEEVVRHQESGLQDDGEIDADGNLRASSSAARRPKLWKPSRRARTVIHDEARKQIRAALQDLHSHWDPADHESKQGRRKEFSMLMPEGGFHFGPRKGVLMFLLGRDRNRLHTAAEVAKRLHRPLWWVLRVRSELIRLAAEDRIRQGEQRRSLSDFVAPPASEGEGWVPSGILPGVYTRPTDLVAVWKQNPVTGETNGYIVRRCARCGRYIPVGRRRTCSAACRKALSRARKSSVTLPAD
jgi:hypothetical protein